MASELMHFTCDSCEATITFPSEKAGETDVCPECFEYIDIPPLVRAASRPRSLTSVTDPAGWTLSFELVDDLPRPEWEACSNQIFCELAEEQWHDAFVAAGHQWLDALGAALGERYRASESQNFLLLSALPDGEPERLLEFCEQALSTILARLDGIASDAGFGKHVLLAFADLETYYTYVSHFHGEGEFGDSAGMFIPDSYHHIALHAARQSLHRTIAHELTHACVAHLPLPAWLNEGITQEVEDILLSQSLFLASPELTQRQKRYWLKHSLEAFWSGQAFLAADEGQELAYALSRIFVRNLTLDFPRTFPEFVRTAQACDAGQAAAIASFGRSLGQIAAEYLGEGAWEPEGPAYECVDVRLRVAGCRGN